MQKITGYKIGLIGNPNTGKSTIFNALTGSHQLIGNWAGSTVEKKEGLLKIAQKNYHIIDLPGIYSISEEMMNPEEKIAHDFLTTGDFDFIINVIDVSNIERNLYLTCQLMEMQIPLLVILNKEDIAQNSGLAVDTEVISRLLHTKVIATNAKKESSVKKIIDAITHFRKTKTVELPYPKAIAKAIENISELLTTETNPTWKAICLLENSLSQNDAISKTLQIALVKEKTHLEATFNEDADILIAGARYEFIASIMRKAVVKKGIKRRNLTDKIDKITLDPIYSLPIFLFVIYLLFTFSITFGNALKEYIEMLSNLLFITIPLEFINWMDLQSNWVHFIVKTLGGGIVTVASFLPLIWGLYFFLSILETSGYMSRGALICDKLLRRLGLPGKAFIPLVIGFGCNVPAIIATRILPSRADRIITVMMSPFMSCSARLSVYALFCAIFFEHNQGLMVLLLYIIGVLCAIMTGILTKWIVGKKSVSSFIMELPNYSMPKMGTILKAANGSTRDFAFGAGKLIVLIYFFIAFAGSWTKDLQYTENINHSIVADFALVLTPAFEPIGIDENNWRAVVGLIAGTMAKEVVVGTLNALYQDHPPGHHYGFKDTISVFCYLLFVLLYFPCISVFAAIAREISLSWAILSAVWSTSLAYFVAASLRFMYI